MCNRADRSAKVKTEVIQQLLQKEKDFAIKMLFKLVLIFVIGLLKNPSNLFRIKCE